MSRKKRRSNAPIFGVLAGIALFAGLLLLALYQKERLYGPVRGTVFKTGEVMIASHAYLHEFTDGKRDRKIPLKLLGLGPVVTDMVALDNGDVLLGDVDHAAVKRCDLGAFTCRTIYDASGAGGPFGKSFKIAVDEKHDRIYATDAENHRLLALNFEGRIMATTPPSGSEFVYPNDVILTTEGLLAIVDTEHSRVAFVDPEATPFGKVADSFNTATKLAIQGFTTPIGLARGAEGSYWAVIASNLAQKGDVVEFAGAEPHGGIKRADLGLDADPLSLLALPDRILVMDPSNLRVRTVMMDGKVAADFGGKEFTDELQTTGRRKQTVETLRLVAQIGLVVMALLALWIALRARKAARTAARAAEPAMFRAAMPAAPQARRVEPAAPMPAANIEAEARPTAAIPTDGRYAIEFTAKAGEYFRIWIVNLVLTILTLGIYSAWAKVRKKRYLYGHTRIDGDGFEYRAKPMAILKGRLIAVAFLVIVSLCGHFVPGSQLVFLGILLFAFPWLVVRTMAFTAYNSAYRNIRLHFRGTYLKCLGIVIMFGLFTIITLGFGYYRLKARLAEFVATNHYFGQTAFAIPDLRKPYWAVYGKFYLGGFFLGLVARGLEAAGSHDTHIGPATYMLLIVYVGYLYLAAFVRAGILNATWGNLSLGEVRFESTMVTREVFWIYLVNIIAILCTLGLAVPWAVVRTMRYRASKLWLIAPDGLEGFIGAESAQVSAAGQEVGEIFDIDVGL